ncbi:MAG: pyruvate kinase, partial [Gammaproteobacteria bacterium]|nr:pyruvate kinase [Gammaproteobacteria bacterium]
TATGRYPVKVLEAMNRVCEAAEQYPEACFSEYRVEHTFKRVDEAIAMASMYTANHLHVKAIACLTESGATPLWMSRINSLLPIFALTRNLETIHRMALVRGVVPIHFDPTRMPYDYVNRSAIDELVRHKAVTDGDLVLVTTGDHMGMHGGTNKMMIVTVGRVA